MNEYDDDEEFQFEQEIDKWVSETEGEEDSEANGDDEAGGSSPTLLDSVRSSADSLLVALTYHLLLPACRVLVS